MDNVSFKELGLDTKILDSLNKLGYKIPTEVQEKVIPMVLKNKDIIVKSQTGSGKTAAFGIPICEEIVIENRKPQALILTPTRELAVQVKDEISSIGRYKAVRCLAVFGKEPFTVQARELKQRVHVISGTPGRVYDHIVRGSFEPSEIKYLVIDEADKMLNMGFIDQVEIIIKALPLNRVTMLFSATLPEKIEALCDKYMLVPQKIEIEHKNKTSESISQYYYIVEEGKKLQSLFRVIYTERPDAGIIFLNTKEGVDRLYNSMKGEGLSVRQIHGGMEQKERLEVMKSFKRGEFKLLIATDVAARGIDVSDIALVINYDLPVELESYVHRIGRTGRAGNKGKAITFVTSYEKRGLEEIEAFIGYKIKEAEDLGDEDIEEGRILYKNSSKELQKPKPDKKAELNKDIMKIYINAGKKKKIRPTDIVGAITNIEGLSAEDIGIIDIRDYVTYVDILGNKGAIVIRELEKGTLKGKKVKVEKASTTE